MFENINILFISAKHDDINAVIKYIKIDKKNVAIASDEKEAIALFDAMSPSVLFFYHSMVEHSQALYPKHRMYKKEKMPDIKMFATSNCAITKETTKLTTPKKPFYS